jgi:alcohol dehydrogenase
MNIQALRERALERIGRPRLSREEAWELLIQTLNDWTQRMDLPRLRAYGIQESDIPRVVTNCRGSSMKTNPVELTDAEVREVLMQRL